MTRLRLTSLLITTMAMSACGSQEKPAESAQPTTSAPEAASTMGENLTPDAGGKIIVVQMLTDEEGNNRFDPSEFEAHPGDVVRYTLKTGVHNVHFLADSNVVKTGLPPATSLLQLPGQTIDIKVTMPAGTYYVQCDPHAALGMKGRLEIEASN